jgi:endonuclease/exonuclease/phosphatase family metal-dependent hydrolase
MRCAISKFSQLAAVIVCVVLFDCESLVTKFEDIEDAKMYTAKQLQNPPVAVDTIMVMTWNIRFGAGRIPWFGDSCGDRVILSEEEVQSNLRGIADMLKDVKPDILLLQEVDIQSKRSSYVNQMQWLLDHTYFNYGAYASVWKAQVIPSDGLGRMDEGNAVLSRWKITDAVRIQLPLRGDQDALTRYFYVRNQ